MIEQYFIEVVEMYYKRWIRNAAYLLKDYADAQDIVSDVLLWVWRHLDSIQPEVDKIRNYISRAIKRRCLSRLEHIRTRRTLGGDYLEGAEVVERELPEIDSPIGIARITEAMSVVNRLPERQQDVISLYYLKGLSYSQISQSMGVAYDTVKKTLDIARYKARNIVHPNQQKVHCSLKRKKKLKKPKIVP